jgi:hypothetical protein
MTISALLLSLAIASMQAPSAATELPAPEHPLSIQIGKDAIAVRVRSNGCTTKDDFKVGVQRGEGTSRLVLWREKPDWCRALIRDGVVLKWTRAELGLGAGETVSVTFPPID